MTKFAGRCGITENEQGLITAFLKRQPQIKTLLVTESFKIIRYSCDCSLKHTPIQYISKGNDLVSIFTSDSLSILSCGGLLVPALCAPEVAPGTLGERVQLGALG